MKALWGGGLGMEIFNSTIREGNWPLIDQLRFISIVFGDRRDLFLLEIANPLTAGGAIY
ncbi:hypothetical protein PPH94_027660 [Burkholderia cepacia]|uniref:hypothetical protein n=1 Tax=Burkholderia cepacia TaxID=292 RepID=UPI00234BFD7B|nr:hypothetical protein [Burkholderia cepacia]MDC6102893.1 hypothetical protein [Burkholderia cepacia]